MILGDGNAEIRVDNDLVEYVVKEVEALFNNEYCISHTSVFIVVESSQYINSAEIELFSYIQRYIIVDSKNSLANMVRRQSIDEKYLVIRFSENSMFDKMSELNCIYPFIISFQTSELSGKTLIGTLSPKYKILNNHIVYERPAEIVISEFE